MTERDAAYDEGGDAFLWLRDTAREVAVDMDALDEALCGALPGKVLDAFRHATAGPYLDGKDVANLSRCVAGLLLDACAKPMHSERPAARVSVKPPPEDHIRRATRVIAMVHELHKAGYQRLRILPGLSPSGCYWRCHILPASAISRDGWQPIDWNLSADDGTEGRPIASYTSGQDNEYFGWKDARHDDARTLATKFVQRFPKLAKEGEGLDWRYAGWLTWILGNAERGDVPVFFADFELELDPADMPPPP